MSNTQGYTTRLNYDSRTITRIARRAKNLIEKSIEQDPTVMLMADVVIDDFSDLVRQLPGTPPLALISKAKLASAPHGIKPKWEHEAGGDLGELALQLSFKVEMNQLSFNEARQQLNRKVRERYNQYKREQSAPKDGRQFKPSIPVYVDRSSLSGTKRSPKQRYRRDKRRKTA